MAKRGGAKQPEPESFEAALNELEELTARMERDDVPLDESLSLYERGIFLRDFCQSRLNAAEQQIERLTRGDDGKLGASPMHADGGAESGT